jgi:hypothetical protein
MKPEVKLFKYLKEKIREQNELIHYCEKERDFYRKLLDELLENER